MTNLSDAEQSRLNQLIATQPEELTGLIFGEALTGSQIEYLHSICDLNEVLLETVQSMEGWHFYNFIRLTHPPLPLNPYANRQLFIKALEYNTRTIERDIMEEYEDFIDEVEEDVTILGMQFLPSRILREVDPIAYREGLLDYINNLEDYRVPDWIIDDLAFDLN